MTKKPSQNTDLYKYIQLFYRTLYGRVHTPQWEGQTPCPLPHFPSLSILPCTLTPTGPHKRHSQSPLHKYCIRHKLCHPLQSLSHLPYHRLYPPPSRAMAFWSSCFLIPFSFIQVHMSGLNASKISPLERNKIRDKIVQMDEIPLDILV